MIDKNAILKFVKHVHKRGRGVADRRLLHPQREWLIGLGVFVVGFAIATLVSMYIFRTYKNIDQVTYEVDKELPVYQAELVTRVLETFAQRELYFDALVAGIQPRIELMEETATTTASSTETALIEEVEQSGGLQSTSSTSSVVSN